MPKVTIADLQRIPPSELPSEINALKAQQHRWTKGAIETARKILPRVWKSTLPLDRKIHSTLHLTGNIVFPFILLAAILNVPLIFIKHQGGYEIYFNIMAVFVFAFLGSFLFYLYSQKDVYADWHKRILLFPLFMAGSMGLAVNNTKAVIEGLLKKKSEFARTPKYSVIVKKDSWTDKKYAPVRVKPTVVLEALMTLYCGFGVLATAFIGSTGSGKSTIISLLPRFYEATKGTILVDGVDIRNVTQHDLREKIGYVPQKGTLFSGTIESNLLYADKNASPEMLESAIQIAQAAEFVSSNPQGLAAEISQGGSNVSGGQKQRLSIARAVVKKPPIYILDDSFSALDFKTDAALRRAFKEQAANSTLLIVTQRVSTIIPNRQVVIVQP